MNFEEKQLRYEYKYKGKIVNMRVDDILLPDGKNAKREVIEHPGGVCVAALTDDKKILLVKQFRYPYGEIIYEIPAGKRDRQNEEPLECGKRELREETGATAERYFSLGELYPTPGYCGEIIWMFGATGLSFGNTDPDEDEFITFEAIEIEKVVNMILSGEIKDA
ncbi:MAG: NUDIX hydrolase, partial [Clostridia bacterium]|nr:NUDIX hydrolase [Clostridia bacterium]